MPNSRAIQQLQALTEQELSVLTIKDFTAEELLVLTQKQLAVLNTHHRTKDKYLGMQEIKVTDTIFKVLQKQLRQQFGTDLDADKLSDTDSKLSKALHQFYLVNKQSNKPNAKRQRKFKDNKKAQGEVQYHTFIAESDTERIDDLLLELQLFQITESNGKIIIHRIRRQSELRLLVTLSYHLVKQQDAIVEVLSQHGFYNHKNSPFISEAQTVLALDNLINLAKQAKPQRKFNSLNYIKSIATKWLSRYFKS